MSESITLGDVALIHKRSIEKGLDPVEKVATWLNIGIEDAKSAIATARKEGLIPESKSARRSA